MKWTNRGGEFGRNLKHCLPGLCRCLQLVASPGYKVGHHLDKWGVNRFSDRRISQKKLFGFRIWRIFYTDLRILLIQQNADLSDILARIVDLACNLVWILDCDFTAELLADSNLDKTIVGLQILLQIWADRRICIPLFTPPPPINTVCDDKPFH